MRTGDKMRVYLSESDYSGTGCVVALGMFDGVHIGHQKLIRCAVMLARRLKSESVVMTFSENPTQILFPDRAPAPLTTLSEKIKRIEAIGADALIVQPFTETFAEISAENYLRTLVRKLSPKAIVVGYNYSFGKGGAGNPDTLKKKEAEYNYQTVVIDPVTYEGTPVSSTAIRALLNDGQAEKARAMLGISNR